MPYDFQVPSTGPWLRLPPATHAQIQPLLKRAPVALWPLAIEAVGRSYAYSPTYLDVPDGLWDEEQAAQTRVLPVLVHAGPEAGRHTRERPRGPEAIENIRCGRTPEPLDSSGWNRMAALYVQAAQHLQRLGARTLVLSVDDDGLLASALSPRTHPSRNLDERTAIVVKIIRALKKTGIGLAVAFTLEELCPHGLDASDGIQVALAMEAEGIDALFISGGTRALEPLRRREAATIADDPFLATANWLVGKTSLPLWAQGPAPDPARAFQHARQHGLAGIVSECFAEADLSIDR